jgi:hypothetical protein
MKVFFDTRELYFLTQYVPVFRVLRERGAECRFALYENRPTQRAAVQRAVGRLGLPARWFADKEAALAWYRAERPEWIVFGNGYGREHLAGLPDGTRTAQLYHGIGTKTDVYGPALMDMDVRFVEGPHYVERLRALYPDANLVAVGYAKVDPLCGPVEERPRLDLAALGLDPAKRTLLYAPTHMPSSFPNMSLRFPEDFADFNVLVKPHSLSFFGGKRRSHRRRMEVWARAPNVHVAAYDEYDPLPYMGSADLLISDESSVLFEYAVLDRPIVWCDFLWVHWTRRGPLAYRLKKRLDETIAPHRAMAAHAPSYRDLRAIVEDQLAHPEGFRDARRRAVAALVGPTDGRVSVRIADHLLTAPPEPRPGRARTAVHA